MIQNLNTNLKSKTEYEDHEEHETRTERQNRLKGTEALEHTNTEEQELELNTDQYTDLWKQNKKKHTHKFTFETEDKNTFEHDKRPLFTFIHAIQLHLDLSHRSLDFWAPSGGTTVWVVRLA